MNSPNEGNGQKQSLNAAKNTLATYCWRSARIFDRRRLRRMAPGQFSSDFQRKRISTSTIRNTTISHPRGSAWDGEVLVRAFGYTVAARYLDNSEEMVRERYSHIEAGELGDVATEALEEIDDVA